MSFICGVPTLIEAMTSPSGLSRRTSMIPFPDALISRLEGTLLNSTPLTAMMPVLLGTVTA